MTSLRLLRVLVVVAVVLAAGAARAQEEEDVEIGRSHFDRGVDYVQDGDLRGALIEFKRAYAASPNYRVLYNLGQVSNELREYTEAQAYFRRYLADGGADVEPARRRDVEALVEKLSSRIANLVLTSSVEGAELFVDDVSVGVSPMSEPVRVSAGTRVISAAVSGRARITQVVEAAGGETLVVKLIFPAASQNEAPAGFSSTRKPAAPEQGSGVALWLGIGSGALAVATGVMAYLAASDASEYHDAVKRKTTARELEDLDNRATAKALVTDILLGATAVATTLTIVVAFTEAGAEETAATSRKKDKSSAQLRVGPASFQVVGQF